MGIDGGAPLGRDMGRRITQGQGIGSWGGLLTDIARCGVARRMVGLGRRRRPLPAGFPNDVQSNLRYGDGRRGEQRHENFLENE